MEKVVVGMSGGVDSSVCAYLLKEEGYEVIGATMQIWESTSCSVEREGACCGFSAINDAREVCDYLNIPHYVMNFKEEFKDKVTRPFIEEYLKGRTPNPCILCNQYLKWGGFLAKARALGADYIATGHYAGIIKLPNGRFTVKKSVTDKKDQTYVLYTLSQDELSHTLMPVGRYDKDTIREIARKIGLPVADKKDSQDICFVENGSYADFIRANSDEPIKEGYFVTGKGERLKKHKGTINYTVGQRRGLDLALGYPAYVKRIDVGSGDIEIATDEELYKDKLFAVNLQYMGEEKFDEEAVYKAKIRYSQSSADCSVKYVDKDNILVTFAEPVRAITPGQAVVLYKDDWIAGGGIITG